MVITYTPTTNKALVTFSASGDYTALVATNAQWINARITVNGATPPNGQASAWLVGVNDASQSANTAWGGSMSITVPVTVGVPTTIRAQWAYATGAGGQFNTLNNKVASDNFSHRNLSVIEVP